MVARQTVSDCLLSSTSPFDKSELFLFAVGIIDNQVLKIHGVATGCFHWDGTDNTARLGPLSSSCQSLGHPDWKCGGPVCA